MAPKKSTGSTGRGRGSGHASPGKKAGAASPARRRVVPTAAKSKPTAEAKNRSRAVSRRALQKDNSRTSQNSQTSRASRASRCSQKSKKKDVSPKQTTLRMNVDSTLRDTEMTKQQPQEVVHGEEDKQGGNPPPPSVAALADDQVMPESKAKAPEEPLRLNPSIPKFLRTSRTLCRRLELPCQSPSRSLMPVLPLPVWQSHRKTMAWIRTWTRARLPSRPGRRKRLLVRLRLPQMC